MNVYLGLSWPKAFFQHLEVSSGVPPVIILFGDFFYINRPFWGLPHLWKPPHGKWNRKWLEDSSGRRCRHARNRRATAILRPNWKSGGTQVFFDWGGLRRDSSLLNLEHGWPKHPVFFFCDSSAPVHVSMYAEWTQHWSVAALHLALM